MSQLPGMPMAMAMTDQGQPVNHHPEVHIYDKATGTVVTQVVPKIVVTNQAMGEARPLTSLAAMYDVKEGQKDLHVGSNVILREGKYMVIVAVGDETTVVKDVTVTGRQ